MINKPGCSHHLAVSKERGVFLRAGVGAKHVARIDREVDQEPGNDLTFANVQLTRVRFTQPFDLRTARIGEAGVEPVGNDFFEIRRITSVDRVRRWWSLPGNAKGGKQRTKCGEKNEFYLPLHARR